MDVRKIVDTLLIMAIAFLFSSIFVLNQAVNGLSQSIAVMDTKMQERNVQSIEKNKQTALEWERRGEIVDSLLAVVQQHGDRLNKLEWALDNEPPRAR